MKIPTEFFVNTPGNSSSVLRGSVHTETATLNIKLTFMVVSVEMPKVRVVAGMS